MLAAQELSLEAPGLCRNRSCNETSPASLYARPQLTEARSTFQSGELLTDFPVRRVGIMYVIAP
jgi:hypothetical protein